jgi:hypothetical protein
MAAERRAAAAKLAEEHAAASADEPIAATLLGPIFPTSLLVFLLLTSAAR